MLVRLVIATVAIGIDGVAGAQSAQMPAEQLHEKLDIAGETVRAGPDTLENHDELAPKSKKVDFLFVPIPQSSPTLGTGLTLTASLFYNPNQSPDPWISAIGLMKTSNGSLVAGALQRMAFDHDRFRITLFGGYGDVNMRFYGVGPSAGDRELSIELNEQGYAAMASGQMRVAENLFVGGRIVYLALESSIHRDNPLFPESEIPASAFESKLVKIGPAITYDSRNSSLDPKDGELVNVSWLFGAGVLGSDYSHHKLAIDGNIYRSIGDNTVVAARAAACAASRDAPFYDLCMYGANSDLRGYEVGRYRDRGSWALQAEVRQGLSGRFGVVAFVGIGMSLSDWSRLDEGKFLPSAGLGLRYRPSRETPVNLRLDYAWARSSHALYLGIGEAF